MGAGGGKIRHFSHADITGPIVLQTYRAIADYEKSSTSEMSLKAGDMVDVVEKSENGMCPSLWRALKASLLPATISAGILCPNTACELVMTVKAEG